ncbi:MAG TPA: FcoT family thioesterase [Labilithrix sp.]|nr:FcoT family thioesterase [Labilithrix sp.]
MSMLNYSAGPRERPKAERWNVSKEVLDTALVCYRDNCKYLKNCSIEYIPIGGGVSPDVSEGSIVAEGDCGLEESCYIDSTGHFNAVEFQIACNQIMYTMFAEVVRRRLVRSFLPLDLDGYWERRLPNVLITNVNSVFRRVINPRKFRARHQLDRSYLIGERAFWESRISYTDDEDGLAEGTVVGTMWLGAKLPPKGS